MKVHILSKVLVKPSTPTLSNLRNYKISFTDELAPTINVPVILYYQSHHTDGASRCNMLKNSLEQALTPFYPFAGRYDKNNRLIDCNDQGVDFVTVQADCQITELLGQGKRLETQVLINQLITSDVQAADEITNPLLAIQVTVFECGGIAFAVCFSHRIRDASTISLLMTGWAAACRGLDIAPFSPVLNTACFYPGRNLPRFKLAWTTGKNGTKSVTKMFVFGREVISTLRGRAKLGKITTNRLPLKLQLVNAALLKALNGVDRVKYGYSRALLIQTTNLREKSSPSVPQRSFGNLWGLVPTKIIADESEGKDFKDYADMLADSVCDAVDKYTKMSLHEKDGHRKVINPFMDCKENICNSEVNSFLFTSWCRFSYYDADFGWGTPVWASAASMPLKNVVILMDKKEGDGIEAWVYLEEKDMLIFEQDSDIAALTK